MTNCIKRAKTIQPSVQCQCFRPVCWYILLYTPPKIQVLLYTLPRIKKLGPLQAWALDRRTPDLFLEPALGSKYSIWWRYIFRDDEESRGRWFVDNVTKK